MHMLFKSGLLIKSNWLGKIGLKNFKMQQNGEILDFKRHYGEFTSSYGAGTKFIRNTGLYGISDVDSSS